MTRYNWLSARTLIDGGVKVFPCREDGPSAKAPYTLRGFKDATTDWPTVQKWFSKYGEAVWGLPCAMNRILVLDADRHGKGDGVANINTLFENNQFDCRNVPVVETPRFGYHFYFRRPDRMGSTKASLCEAVDVRDDAYVIAPGSTMRDGRSYKLLDGTLPQLAKAIANNSLPDPPAWLEAILLRPPVPVRSEITQTLDDEVVWNLMKGVVKAVLQAEDGSRNRLLYWAACRFGEMVRADPERHELAQALLERAGMQLGLSSRETRATVASGLRQASQGDQNAC